MPNVAGKRVVIFGDSLSSGAGSPGYELGAALARAGAKVHIDARVSRSANNFFARESPADHWATIAAFQPDIAIVELGTNDIGLNMTVDRSHMNAIRQALESSGRNGEKIPVHAFGPPAFADARSNAGAQDVVRMMLDVFGSRFIDMRPITADIVTAAAGRSSDGVHFNSQGGRIVGDRMATQFLATDSGSALGLLVAIGIGVAAWFAFR